MGVADITQKFHLSGGAIVTSENRAMIARFICVQIEYADLIMTELKAAFTEYNAPDVAPSPPRRGDEFDSDDEPIGPAAVAAAAARRGTAHESRAALALEAENYENFDAVAIDYGMSDNSDAIHGAFEDLGAQVGNCKVHIARNIPRKSRLNIADGETHLEVAAELRRDFLNIAANTMYQGVGRSEARWFARPRERARINSASRCFR